MVIPRLKKRTRSQEVRIGISAAILGIVLLLRWLSERFEAPQLALSVLGNIIFAAVAFFVANIVIRFTAKPVRSIIADADIEARLILAKLYSAVIFLIAATIVLVKLGVNAGNITIFLGFLATGFAFSIRDVITAYLAWFILLTKKPFRIKDTIEIDGILGRVQHIGTFFVLVDETPQTRSDFRKIPNALFLQKPVHNYGRERIPATFEVHVRRIPSDFIEKRATIEAELSDLNATVSIGSIEGSLTITCDYTYLLEERYTTQHRVAQTIVTSFNVTQA